MSAISAQGLGKRYGSKWALRDCTIEVPEGSVTALVGQRRRQDDAAAARRRAHPAEPTDTARTPVAGPAAGLRYPARCKAVHT
jgi:ABC-2 type transport system ATP-binding protein